MARALTWGREIASMGPRGEFVLTSVIAGVAIIALIRGRVRPGPETRQPSNWLLGLLALASILAWTNFGRFHAGGHFVHAWEQFHYALGAKYSGELRHDGLYVASLQAQVETAPGVPLPATTRDLRNSWIVPTSSLREHADEVKARFSPERWSTFLRDHAVHLTAILDQGGLDHLARVRRDHGFNGTPAWVFAARLFGAELPASTRALVFFGCVDFLLLSLAFLVVVRTYGARVACVGAIVLGLGHAWAFFWIGGSFLRLDWFVAVVLAACAARSGRLATAGALLGYASVVRLFPAALLLGPAIACTREWAETRTPRALARLLGGFSLAVVLGVGAGCLTGRGVHAWADFAAKIHGHERTWLTNNVGLRNVVLYDREMLAGTFEDRPGDNWGDRLDRAESRRRPLLAVLAIGVMLLVALAAFQLAADEAIAIGIVAPFALAAPTSYYWVMLVLVVLRRGTWMPITVIVLGIAGNAAELAGAEAETTFGLLSWALAIAFVAWLLPDAAQTFRQLRARGLHDLRRSAS